jgi:glyoxylase-like metal-dependent hydrolase (beta-lactamase superfamily II)
MSTYLDVFDENDFGTNCWLLAAEGSDDAVVIDPGFAPERVHDMLRAAGKRPVAVLATHGHWDHVGSAGAFCGEDLPLYIHEADRLALTDPVAWGAGHPVPRTPVHDVRTVVEGDRLDFAGFSIEVIHTPGHTPGSVCFATDGWLFSGDLVFKGSIGRHDFPNSSPADMEKSLRRFLLLPDPLPVHPGHGPDTTVGDERRTNPYLVELR